MKITAVFFLLIFISGCSVFNSQYSCQEGYEDGCKPLSQVYDNTSGEVEDYRYQSSYKNKDSVIQSVNISERKQRLDRVNPGDPILSKPIVMRVLYRSFENDQNDLDAGGYTFLRMRESEWITKK